MPGGGLTSASILPPTQHEFKDVYLQVFPHISEHEFQQVWSSLDENRDGELSLEELARHYGYDLVDLTDEGMTDEKILELLEVRAATPTSEAALPPALKTSGHLIGG